MTLETQQGAHDAPPASFDPLDWGLAERVARRVAGRDPLSSSYLAESLRADFSAVTAVAEQLVTEHTGLRSPSPARAQVVDRATWVSANVRSMRRLLEPLTARVGERMAGSPVAPLGRRIAGTETGVLLGYLAQRVLGQYDLLVLDEEEGASDAVYYVGGNILALEKRFAFRPRDFRLWIAIHECTHRAQFTAVSWMKPYYLSLVDATLSSIDPDPRRLVGALARAAEELRNGRNPLDDGGLVALLATDEQRGALARVQSLMSLLEGHGNSVMNRIGRDHVAGQARMARVLHSRRQTTGVAAVLHKIIGLDSKMRQYEVGETFIAAVERAAGPRAIDAAWRGPEWLPSLEELQDPQGWLARGGVTAPSPADPLAPYRKRFAATTVDLTAPVIVGCSGGADSVALLALTADAELAPIAVHVDHGLRPESAHESDHVGALAARLGGGFDARVVGIESGSNLEERARDARAVTRHSMPARIEHGATAVLIGHTADDQAETVLLNVLRGAASAGLSGMPARRGFLARPLLGFRRAETSTLCETLGLVTLRDPMNDDEAFRRVAVRRRVLPMLEGVAGRDLVPVLARQAELLREDSDFLDDLARAAWPGADGVSAERLAVLPPVLARRAVRLWLGPPPPSLAEVTRVLQVAAGEHRATELIGGRTVRRTAGQLRVDASG